MNYKKMIKPYENNIVDSLVNFINIDSVLDLDTASKEMPFGKGVDESLKFIADLGVRFGFDVDMCDGYCTELSFGKGERLISIFAHSDVVPISGDWKYKPFDAMIEDGIMYGRGTSDDKGPLIAAFFAIKALKDNDLIKNYRIKLIVGGDEESGSRCLHHYFDVLKKEHPTYGFTPDSDFPLIYGEKGTAPFEANIKIEGIDDIVSMKGGTVFNAVCDDLLVKFKSTPTEFIDYLEKNNVIFKHNNDEIHFLGKTAHGSIPHEGINAAVLGFKYIGEFYNQDELINISNHLTKTDGSSFEGYNKGNHLGHTTYNLGLISFEDNLLSLFIDFRFPEGSNAEKLISNFDKYLKTSSKYEKIGQCLLFDTNSDLISTLMNAYQKETKDMTPPLTTGGGTYAKHAKNTVAFGALFPNQPSTMHQPDERIVVKDLFKICAIYARAINDLGNIK